MGDGRWLQEGGGGRKRCCIAERSMHGNIRRRLLVAHACGADAHAHALQSCFKLQHARRHGAHEREDDVLPSMHKQWGVSLMIHSFSEKWKFWTQ